MVVVAFMAMIPFSMFVSDLIVGDFLQTKVFIVPSLSNFVLFIVGGLIGILFINILANFPKPKIEYLTEEEFQKELKRMSLTQNPIEG